MRARGGALVTARGLIGSTTTRAGSTARIAGSASTGIAGRGWVLSTKNDSVSKQNTPGTSGSQ